MTTRERTPRQTARALARLARWRARGGWRALLRLRPRSFRSLLVLGFAAVTLPLAGALLATSFELNRLAIDSQEAVSRAVRASDSAQRLVDGVEATERSARRYLVLRDRNDYAEYLRRRARVLRAAEAVALNVPSERNTIKVLIADLNVVHGVLRGRATRATQRRVVSLFDGLAASAAGLTVAARAQADREARLMRERAERTRTLLFWQAAALFAVAGALAWYFLRIIARPVRALDAAIRALGDGRALGEDQVREAITVDGPRDFVELGHRLEWLRDRLGEADAQKSRFLRHVSHELKTPMTAIREGSNLLLEEVPGPLNEMQGEVIRIVRDNARKLEHSIEDLLGITRLPQGIDYRDDWRDVRLDDTVQDVLRAHALSCTSKQLRIETAVEPAVVRGSPAALATIIDNLVSNAVKYSPPQGRLRIVLRNERDRAWLEVEDDGPGIAPADREAIFEPFVRGSRQPEIEVSGTGVGLTIAREVAEAHGGEIQVVDGQGGGGCMQLRLPLAADDNQDA